MRKHLVKFYLVFNKTANLSPLDAIFLFSTIEYSRIVSTTCYETRFELSEFPIRTV